MAGSPTKWQEDLATLRESSPAPIAGSPPRSHLYISAKSSVMSRFSRRDWKADLETNKASSPELQKLTAVEEDIKV
jgi:hypothetical protein